MACSLLALVCGACSILGIVGDLSTDQCQNDADCRKLGAALTCSAGTCVGPTGNNLDGGGEGGGADAAPPCESNAQCIDDNFGAPHICDKTPGSATLGKCLSIQQEGCAFVEPEAELRKENVVVFGAFIPLKDQSGPLGQPIPLAYKLALGEINEVGGLPGGTGSPRKSMVAIFCDSHPDSVEPAVKHLTQTLHVPAIISLFSQTQMTTLFQDYLSKSETFTLNPQDTTEALKLIDAKQLLWHLLGTPEDIALAYRPLIERVETYVKNQPGGPSSVRVALVKSNSPTENSIATVIREPYEAPGRGIRFNNGKSCDENGVDGNFLSIEVPSKEADPNATYNSKIDEIAAFRPDIVILLSSSLEIDSIVGSVNTVNDQLYTPGLDAKMKTVDAGAGPRLPFYVLGPRNARNPEFLAYLKSGHTELSTTKFKRFVGLQYAGAADKANLQSQYQQYLRRFAEKNSTTPLEAYSSTENYYDAVYWLAYGLFAAGPGAPVKGPSFATGVRKLLSGPEIYPGTGKLDDAFGNISNSASGTTFVGAMGKPNFNTASGAQLSVGAVYCYQQDPNDGAFKPRYDTYRYDRATGTLTNPPDGFCFIGF